jgi:hypothetical protein
MCSQCLGHVIELTHVPLISSSQITGKTCRNLPRIRPRPGRCGSLDVATRNSPLAAFADFAEINAYTTQNDGEAY